MAKRIQSFSHDINKGFTYIGLLIIIAIISLCATMSFQAGSLFQRNEREAELLFIGSQFNNAFLSYYNSTPAGQQGYPKTLNDLLKDTRTPVTHRHIRKLYIDPITGAPWELQIAPEGGISGIHSRSTAPPLKHTNFPVELSNLEGKGKYSDWIFGYQPRLPH